MTTAMALTDTEAQAKSFVQNFKTLNGAEHAIAISVADDAISFQGNDLEGNWLAIVSTLPIIVGQSGSKADEIANKT